MPKEWNKVLLAFTETFPDTFTKESVKVSLRCHCAASHVLMLPCFKLCTSIVAHSDFKSFQSIEERMHAQQPITCLPDYTMWTAYVQQLGLRLAAVAGDIDHALDTDVKQLHGLQTIVHGDFKTANLFFSPSAGACVCVFAACTE